MNEHQLAGLLRLVDEPEGLDADALYFKEQLRLELEETLSVNEPPGRTQLVLAEPASGRPVGHQGRATWLAVAAAILLTVVGVALVVGQTREDAPADRPAPATVPVATLPVLLPEQACSRFRTSGAFGLVSESPSGQITSADLRDALAAIDVLVIDVEEAGVDEAFSRTLRNVRGAVNEARLRFEANDQPGVDRALEFARLELSTAAAPPGFEDCLAR